jgi:hypothetical protein
MRKYGCFEVVAENYEPFEGAFDVPVGAVTRADGRIVNGSGERIGRVIDGAPKVGFNTPSGLLEFCSPTMSDWGWSEREYLVPWTVESHVSPRRIDRGNGEMLLLPNFRLPTLIHTRSANAKWLYEISHRNPIWMHPSDARRLGLASGELARVETEIGWFVDKVWVTEGIKPGIIAMSHHLGRWRLAEDQGGRRGTSALVEIRGGDGASDSGEASSPTGYTLNILQGAQAWDSCDPDTSRIWWQDVGVHQNLTHAVHPDPVSGAHCWLQRALSVRKAEPGERHGDVFVDTIKSMQVYRDWMDWTRPASKHSPDGTRRPTWLKRPLKPVLAAYALPPKS